MRLDAHPLCLFHSAARLFPALLVAVITVGPKTFADLPAPAPGFASPGPIASDEAWTQVALSAGESPDVSVSPLAPDPIVLCSGADAVAPLPSEDDGNCGRDDWARGSKALGCCDVSDARAERRFYITGILGASFATLATGGAVEFNGSSYPANGAVNDTLFTAGGAAGIAFDRDNGQLRAEFEARGRDLMLGQNDLFFPDGEFFDNPQVRAADGWSTMANLWRDFDVGDRAGIYAGGGIGAGGYRLAAVYPPPPTAASSVAEFAWQAGGGVTYAFTERLTIDLGYRFFSIGTGTSSITAPPNPFGEFGGVATSSFTASELLLSVRLYEPFRNWR